MLYTPLLQTLFPWVKFKESDPIVNAVYLTFDDGPDPDPTRRIAEILHRFDASATFFVTGKQAEKYPGIVEMLDRENHLICNHSYSHYKSFLPAKKKLIREMDRTQNLLAGIIPSPGGYFRPPHGRISPALKNIAQSRELIVTLWDVFVPDYKPGYPAIKIIQRIEKYSSNGSIILLHDRSKNTDQTGKALPDVIIRLRDSGFTLCKLPTKAAKR
ncbi:MAG TPA: polysaccharide deacetylase family protein [Bacteroidetes bacterium]|nr:polysaccharide deacetylase family protein [Bacteroidota bacterium]